MTVVIQQGAVLTSDSRGFVLRLRTQNCEFSICINYVTGSSLADITSKAESSFLANLTSGAASQSDNGRQKVFRFGRVMDWWSSGGGKLAVGRRSTLDG